MHLSPYGVREWGTSLGIFGAVLGLLLLINPSTSVLISIMMPATLLLLSIFWFFRDPDRTVPEDATSGHLISPADGVVSAIERHDFHEDLKGPAVVIRIFLSVLDVHVNRYPCDGEVHSSRHVPGRHLDARKAQCPVENEYQMIMMDRSDGVRIGIRQIAGLIARRIVCHATPGSAARTGLRFGMIKFGSSTELILPAEQDLSIEVSTGERVWCGRSPLAILPERQPRTD